MPNMTTNYNLVKPLQEETYDVDVFNSNCDIIDALFKKFEDRFTPHIGDTIITLDGTNPSERYSGTTWELMEEGEFIKSAGTTVNAGGVTGNNTITFGIENLPKHRIEFTTEAAGGHNHYSVNGFTEAGFDTTNGGGESDGGDPLRVAVGDNVPYHGNKWAAVTSTAGNHTHHGYTNYIGENKPIDITPKGKAFYIWIRTA